MDIDKEIKKYQDEEKTDKGLDKLADEFVVAEDELAKKLMPEDKD